MIGKTGVQFRTTLPVDSVMCVCVCVCETVSSSRDDLNIQKGVKSACQCYNTRVIIFLHGKGDGSGISNKSVQKERAGGVKRERLNEKRQQLISYRLVL